MESAEREIFSLIGSVSSVFSLLVAIAVLVLGIVVVRPLNKVAGIAFSGAGGGRLLGLGLDMVLDALQPKETGTSSSMIFYALGTLIWIVTAVIFYGGVMFGAVKLADTQPQPQPQRGAW